MVRKVLFLRLMAVIKSLKKENLISKDSKFRELLKN